MAKLENVKNGQIRKNFFKKGNLVLSKPENHNLRRKTGIDVTF